jgi:hypothetical protein
MSPLQSRTAKGVSNTNYAPLVNPENSYQDRSHDDVSTNVESIHMENYPQSHVQDPFLPGQRRPVSHDVLSEKLVKWSIHWKTPTFMVALLLAGVGFGLGHHFYYASLDGTTAGSPSRQQWATRFGTAFSFLVVAVLKTASDAAYSQYIWTLVRRKSFSLKVLDKMFSLTMDPLGFLSLHLLKHAKIGVLLALISW